MDYYLDNMDFSKSNSEKYGVEIKWQLSDLSKH